MHKQYATLLIIILLFSCCATQKKVAKPSDWKGQTLLFASGGGFTGLTTTYTLLENGQLFSQSGITDGVVKELQSVDKKKVKSLFAGAAKIKWSDENIVHPGNMHYTVIYKTGGKEHEITWGDGKYTPPAEVEQLYKDLNAILLPKQ